MFYGVPKHDIGYKDYGAISGSLFRSLEAGGSSPAKCISVVIDLILRFGHSDLDEPH